MEIFRTTLAEADRLPRVSEAAAATYRQKMNQLAHYVDESLAQHHQLDDLIGNQALQVLYDNHRHHAAFMAAVLSIGRYDLLVKTVIWVYRTYHAHGFPYDYFVFELQAWIKALEGFLGTGEASEIRQVYVWMLTHHRQFVELAESGEGLQKPEIETEWNQERDQFLAAILEGDHRRCLQLAETLVNSGETMVRFYTEIVQPTMYEIGRLWENGTISVAHEHLASAIIARIMTSISMIDTVSGPYKGKAIIAATPNEYHEIGAWMIADALEHHGWQIRYLGANTPQADLVELVRSYRPEVLALSATMPFNLIKLREVVAAIRSEPELAGVRIMVGGQVLNDFPDLWKTTGADGHATDIHRAVKLADEWRAENAR